MAVTEPSNTLSRPQSGGASVPSSYVRQLAEIFADASVPRTFSTYSQSVWRSQFNLVLRVLGDQPLVLAAPSMLAVLKRAGAVASSVVEGCEGDMLALRNEILTVLKTAEVRA